jgi:hypothetical protein
LLFYVNNPGIESHGFLAFPQLPRQVANRAKLHLCSHKILRV